MIIDLVSQLHVRIMVDSLFVLIMPQSCSSFLGICHETSNTTFACLCPAGWTGDRCKTMINFCKNVTCKNNGICRPSSMNYTCQCLAGSSSGRYCQTVAANFSLHDIIAKCIAYVAILAILSVAAFVVTMDILKYWFGIDPAKRPKQSKTKKRRKHRPVLQRFVYVIDAAHLNELNTAAGHIKRNKKITIGETRF